MKRPLKCLALLAALALGCQAPHRLEMPSLASAQVSNDFETYKIQRVGLLPFTGRDIDLGRDELFQLAFLSEIVQSTPYEVVLLDRRDMEEIEESEPHRRGWYRPRTIIELSRRYSLDAVIFGTVTQQRTFPPQLLSLEVDMVSAETGLVIWSSSLHLDATNPKVVDGLKIYWGDKHDKRAWELSLLSPERFARFAAFQVACLL